MTRVHLAFWTDQNGEAAGEAAFAWAIKGRLATHQTAMKWRKRSAPPREFPVQGRYVLMHEYELVIEIPDSPKTMMEQGG